MIPVYGVPVLNRKDLFHRMVMSYDHPTELLYVVDNGNIMPRDMVYSQFSRIHVADLGYNAGVAASWNLIIRANFNAPWWLLGCNDINIQPGILDRVVEEMESIGDSMPHLCRVAMGNEDWGNHFGLFAMNPALIDSVGWFDENFYPIYFEDTEYLIRIRQSRINVKMTTIPSRTHHDGNMSWKNDPHLAAKNKVSWSGNAEYITRKWGPEGSHKYDTAFNEERSPNEWAQPSISRMRSQQW